MLARSPPTLLWPLRLSIPAAFAAATTARQLELDRFRKSYTRKDFSADSLRWAAASILWPAAADTTALADTTMQADTTAVSDTLAIVDPAAPADSVALLEALPDSLLPERPEKLILKPQN